MKSRRSANGVPDAVRCCLKSSSPSTTIGIVTIVLSHCLTVPAAIHQPLPVTIYSQTSLVVANHQFHQPSHTIAIASHFPSPIIISHEPVANHTPLRTTYYSHLLPIACCRLPPMTIPFARHCLRLSAKTYIGITINHHLL